MQARVDQDILKKCSYCNNIKVSYNESIFACNSDWSSVCNLDCPNIFVIEHDMVTKVEP